MCEVTKRALMAVVNADETTTDDERRRIEAAIAGEYEALTITEVADRLSVTRPTVYAMVRAGKLKRLADGRICGKSVADYFEGKRKGVQCEQI